MQVVLFVHVLCVLLFLGAAVVERVGEASPAVREWRSLFEGRSDLIVAAPALLGALVTGGYLASQEPPTPLLALRTSAGLVSFGVIVYGLLLAGDRPIEARSDRSGKAKAPERGVASVALVGVGIALATSLHLFLVH
jgi:hypothetical protein